MRPTKLRRRGKARRGLVGEKKREIVQRDRKTGDAYRSAPPPKKVSR